MTQPFGHEKLIVYQKGMRFVDLATANGATYVSRVEQGRELLRRIAAMLTALSKAVGND